ncbi:hypothetical protein LSAT2_029367 [Lamellibrachia satsuma]|nr:hypothetical protein LSAT2_029367 [Lamellibrachia satsuma]
MPPYAPPSARTLTHLHARVLTRKQNVRVHTHTRDFLVRTCEIRKRPSLLNKRKLSAMLPELQQHRAVKPEAKPEPKPRPAPLERIATLPSKKLQKILPKPNVPTTPLAASITKESTDMEDIKDIMRTMGRKKMERKLRRRTRHHLGSESETESQNSEERQLPDKPAWMTTALGISMKAARFKVPVDARVLQDMTPLDYVKRYCVATSHRINLCRKIYRRNQQQAQTMNFEGLVSALGELFTTNLDKDGLDKIINLLAVDEHIRVDEKLFIAIAAFTERVLCPRPATDNSESKTVHHKKDMLEYADFRRTAQNIKNVKVAPNVQRIIQILMEQLER